MLFEKVCEGETLEGGLSLIFFVLLESINTVLLLFLLFFNLNSKQIGPARHVDSIGLTKPQIQILGEVLDNSTRFLTERQHEISRVKRKFNRLMKTQETKPEASRDHDEV